MSQQRLVGSLIPVARNTTPLGSKWGLWPSSRASHLIFNQFIYRTKSEILEQRDLCRVDVVDIIPVSLHTRNTRLEEAIPNASLFTIVMTRLPALAMVKIMVLNHQFHITQSQQPGPRIHRSRFHAKTTVAQNLREYNILLANPPLVKAHGEPHRFHRAVCHQRDTDKVEELLHCVCVCGQEGIRVLCEMVGAMESP